MAISAKDVMELRKQTDCGMMECKKALTEADGNFEKAIEILRERGLATAAKKASRTAAEGMVYADYCPQCKVGVVIEVNAETDFVAKNDKFVAFVKEALHTSTAAAPTAFWSTSRPPTASRLRTSSLPTARTSPCRSQLLTPAMSMRLLSPLRSWPRRRRSCWLRWLAIPRPLTSPRL